MQKPQEDNNWESRYQAGTTGWDRGSTSPNLNHWLASGDLTPCRVLVPGCGNGYEVLTLAAQAFDVVAVDIAPTPVANLKEALEKNQLKGEIIQSDFFALNYQNEFDAIYEQTCLCALPPALWVKFEDWLYQSLKPEGKLYAQFMQTGQEGGPPFHCDMTEMKQLFTSDRWKWHQENQRNVMETQNDKHEIPCLLEKLA